MDNYGYIGYYNVGPPNDSKIFLMIPIAKLVYNSRTYGSWYLQR